jgi:hypothetical protein
MAVAGGIEVPITLGGVREVRQQIKQLRGELINATDPAEVARLSDNIGQLSDKLKDANEKANVFASGSKFEQAGNAIGLMKSQIASLDFEGAGESAALFANRIKAINPAEFGTQIKGLVSVVGNLGKAFISMGATILMNPIFLIAAAVAAIIAAVAALLNKLGLLKPILNAIGDVFRAIGEAIDWVIQKIKDFLDWLELTNYAEQDAAAAAAEAAEKRADAWEKFGESRTKVLNQQIRMDELDGKNTTELELKKQFLIRQTAKERAKAIEARIKEMLISGDVDKEELKKLGEQRKEQLNIIQQTKDDAAYIRKKDAKEREEDEKKTSDASVKNAQDEAKRRAEAYKKYRDDRIAVEREIQDLIIAGIRDDESREKAERDARFTRQLEDIKKNEKYTADERLKLTNLLTLNYNAQVAAEEDARRQEELQKKKEFEDEKLRLEKEADMASLDAAATNADAQYAIVEGLAQKEVERVRMTEEEKLNALRGGFGAIGDLAEAWAGKDKARQKKAFQINKAMNIATATIDTYKGATAAYASAGGNPILGSIMAAIVVASGLANIAKIKATQFEGGGNAAPTSTASSATATPTAMQPTFNFQGSGNNANSLNSQNDLSMITVKAVVSESEVTSTQNQVSKYENSAKL